MTLPAAPAKASSSTSTLKAIGKRLLADILQFDNPVVAAGAATTLIADLNLFGLNLGPHGAQIAAILATVGAIASASKKLITQLRKPKPAPAPVAKH